MSETREFLISEWASACALRGWDNVSADERLARLLAKPESEQTPDEQDAVEYVEGFLARWEGYAYELQP